MPEAADVKTEYEVTGFLALFEMVGVLARRRYATAERCYSALGLNHTEARLLTLLHQDGGATTQDELSNLLYIDRSNAGRALKRLELEGYIVRRRDDTDKRTNHVKITAKGQETVVEVSKLRNKIAESFFGDLKEEEADKIVDLLNKALANEGHGMRSRNTGTKR